MNVEVHIETLVLDGNVGAGREKALDAVSLEVGALIAKAASSPPFTRGRNTSQIDRRNFERGRGAILRTVCGEITRAVHGKLGHD